MRSVREALGAREGGCWPRGQPFRLIHAYVLSLPLGLLAVLLIAAAGAGLLAGQIPARRAARLDVLTALASE